MGKLYKGNIYNNANANAKANGMELKCNWGGEGKGMGAGSIITLYLDGQVYYWYYAVVICKINNIMDGMG